MSRTSVFSKGFTILELSFVTFIAGLLILGFLNIYAIYLRGHREQATYTRLEKINEAMSSFYGSQKRYPCPARPNLPIDDPMAGVEDCDATIVLDTCDPAKGLCRVTGRNTPYDGANVDPVYIGVVPYRTLRMGLNDLNPDDGVVQDDISILNSAAMVGGGTLLPDNINTSTIKYTDAIDSWGNKISYAITASLTARNTFNESYGAVDVRTEQGVSLVNPAGSGFWVAVSHGMDAVGAYGEGGVQAVPCAGVGRDRENCDNDASFISGIQARVDGADHFDDLVFFNTERIIALWDPAGMAGEDIATRNIGNMGIGLPPATIPQQKLDVGGTVRGSTIQSLEVCDASGSDCFNPNLLGGPSGLTCESQPGDPANSFRLMTGIANNMPVCTAPILMPATINPGTCPGGTHIVGIDLNGDIICESL